MADTEAASSALHNLLSDLIPYPVFRILASFSNLLYRLFLNTSNDPSSLTSTLLPPLITLGLAYVALLMAYRTVRSMLSLAWFGIKWGAIIGGLIAVWAWYTDNADAVNSMGRAQNGGFMGQMNSMGGLMNTLYTQIPGLAPSTTSSGRTRRRSTRRRNQPATFEMPDDLGSGFGAFGDLFGRPTDTQADNNGVDFSSLLRTIVTEGQRQGIDALSALRAAGRVQDELARFQQDPTGWFEGVGQRFRTPNPAEAQPRRTRSQRRQEQNPHGDSWWTQAGNFFKSEPGQNTRRRRN